MPNIIEITDFDTPELDVYARLSEAQLLHFYEPEGGIFIAESPKVIERALAFDAKAQNANRGYKIRIHILLDLYI